jgi:uncharacterized protein
MITESKIARNESFARTLATLAIAAVLAACAGATSGRAAVAPSESPGEAEVTLVGPDEREVEVPVEVAADPQSRRRGLMGRDDLPDGSGMVFLFPAPTGGPFWMKDTRIPLSIAFYGDDGAILRILDMEPCAADPCPLYDPGVTYRGALEVEQGLFGELGVVPGWRILLPADLPEPS